MTNQAKAEAFINKPTMANRERLFMAFVPLANQIVKKFHRANKSVEDERQIAYIQLNKAISTYDITKKTAFVTYAYAVIRNNFISRANKSKKALDAACELLPHHQATMCHNDSKYDRRRAKARQKVAFQKAFRKLPARIKPLAIDYFADRYTKKELQKKHCNTMRTYYRYRQEIYTHLRVELIKSKKEIKEQIETERLYRLIGGFYGNKRRY